jgi:adenosylmethionine-8-amino-7-oxononanoate aminotransferase
VLLAARLAELAPGDLSVTYFATGGAEANDTAYKIARLYRNLRGRDGKVQIVSRLRGYHGLTYGATGLPNFTRRHRTRTAMTATARRARATPAPSSR